MILRGINIGMRKLHERVRKILKENSNDLVDRFKLECQKCAEAFLLDLEPYEEGSWEGGYRIVATLRPPGVDDRKYVVGLSFAGNSGVLTGYVAIGTHEERLGSQSIKADPNDHGFDLFFSADNVRGQMNQLESDRIRPAYRNAGKR